MDEKLKSIIEIDSKGRLSIPQLFYDRLKLGPSSTVEVSIERNKIVVRPHSEEDIRPRCLKCGTQMGVSIKVPLCEICLNQYLSKLIKERNKK